VQDTGGENPYIDTQDVFRASDCGRLGRQAAGSPLERAPHGEKLPKPKQQLCIQNGTRAHYLNHLQRGEGEAGKEAREIGLGYQVIDRQAEDRQTGRNKVDERWYPSRPCSVLNSGLRTLRR
jgi:hypothetical protein